MIIVHGCVPVKGLGDERLEDSTNLGDPEAIA